MSRHKPARPTLSGKPFPSRAYTLHPTPCARAFTLIELLIVISILAILMGIMAPVVAQVREVARGYTCVSNLRQIGIATTLYASDYDEQYACASTEPQRWLPDVHAAYLKQWRVWICPDDGEAQVWDERWGSPSFLVRTSYIWNAYVFQGDAATWQRAISLSAVSTPATLPVWAEGYANAGWVNDAVPLSNPDPGLAFIHNTYGDNFNARPGDTSAAPCAAYHARHLDVVHHGGGNYAFADGHAAWKRPDKFTTDNLTNNGVLVDDRTDPFVTNGARSAALSRALLCPVFCCPQPYGTPPGDGHHAWFRP